MRSCESGGKDIQNREGNDKLWQMLPTGQVRWELRLDHWIYLYEDEQSSWGGGEYIIRIGF